MLSAAKHLDRDSSLALLRNVRIGDVRAPLVGAPEGRPNVNAGTIGPPALSYSE